MNLVLKHSIVEKLHQRIPELYIVLCNILHAIIEPSLAFERIIALLAHIFEMDRICVRFLGELTLISISAIF